MKLSDTNGLGVEGIVKLNEKLIKDSEFHENGVVILDFMK